MDTDHLLWHDAAHAVDLFAWQCGAPIVAANALRGPIIRRLASPPHVDPAQEHLCTLALSFNNDGPLDTFFRYICDSGTCIARYDDLTDGNDNKIEISNVDVAINRIELQDGAFFAAIREGREPNGSGAGAAVLSSVAAVGEASLGQVRETRHSHVGAFALLASAYRALPTKFTLTPDLAAERPTSFDIKRSEHREQDTASFVRELRR